MRIKTKFKFRIKTILIAENTNKQFDICFCLFVTKKKVKMEKK